EPSTSKNDAIIDQVRNLVMQNRRITIRELVDEVNISLGPFNQFLLFDFF
ncbi:Uncharacterized protein FKW44_009270, partial [Caligus rogercresseyi]